MYGSNALAIDPSCQGRKKLRNPGRWLDTLVPETEVPKTEVLGQGDAESRSEIVAGSEGCSVAVERILESLPKHVSRMRLGHKPVGILYAWWAGFDRVWRDVYYATGGRIQHMVLRLVVVNASNARCMRWWDLLSRSAARESTAESPCVIRVLLRDFC